ncbi:hypothetical protein HanPSC8_Chr09g0396651 [Helianthus annuus]|nr:hypothetical protein HanPSC8_Chr09g0396651 [Helianthus annuus]
MRNADFRQRLRGRFQTSVRSLSLRAKIGCFRCRRRFRFWYVQCERNLIMDQ